MPRLLGEGWDNVVYEAEGELVLRFSKEPDPQVRAARVEREARLLRVVAEVSPLRVPEPLFVRPEQGCLAYRKLPGVPLMEAPADQRRAHAQPIGRTLGGFLGALHGVPLDRVQRLVDLDHQPLAEWQAEAAELFGRHRQRIPELYQPAIRRFFDSAPPQDPAALVFSHNDLGMEHVLIDLRNLNVCGVLDWGDAAIADPAYDFGLIYRDLGSPALEAAISSYPGPARGLRKRAVFYARCSVFEDLAYGLESGRQMYVDNSLAALATLFSP